MPFFSSLRSPIARPYQTSTRVFGILSLGRPGTVTQFLLGLVVIVVLFGIVSCRPDRGKKEDGTVFTDDLARQVTIRLPSKRVVSLAPSLSEMIVTAGGASHLVGITNVDDFPPVILNLPRFSILPLDQEAIISLKPDLIFASDQINNPDDMTTFTRIGIPSYFLASRKLSDVFNGIRTIGKLLGTESTADLRADSLENSLNLLESKTDSISHRPIVLLLISDQTLFAFGKESYVHELIRISGGISATGTIQSEKPILTDEFVLKTRPDVIVGTFGKSYSTDNLLKYHPSWTVLPAVQHNRVFNIDESLIQRPGPRLVDAAWQIASFLHPDLVKTHISPQNDDKQ